MPHVTTIADPVVAEIEKVRGSRFVCRLAPAADEAQALAVVDAVRAADPDATHHCWAYRLADGRERASDDGEPRGTAGAPMLRHLGGADVTDVVAVVTRHYGGTKLGTGGLIRAYGDATAAALDAASIIRVAVTATVRIQHGYPDLGVVDGVVAAHDGIVEDAVFTDDVARVIRVDAEHLTDLRESLIEATADRIVLDPDADAAT